MSTFPKVFSLLLQCEGLYKEHGVSVSEKLAHPILKDLTIYGQCI